MLSYCVAVQSLSRVWLFATPWTAAHQASLSFTLSRSLLKLMSIESVMPSSHLILCHLLLLLPSIFPSIRVFSNESALCIRWPKYWSFSFSISPSSEYSGPISFRRTGWISLQSKGLSRVFSNTTAPKLQFFCTQPSLWSNLHICTWPLEKHVIRSTSSFLNQGQEGSTSRAPGECGSSFQATESRDTHMTPSTRKETLDPVAPLLPVSLLLLLQSTLLLWEIQESVHTDFSGNSYHPVCWLLSRTC